MNNTLNTLDVLRFAAALVDLYRQDANAAAEDLIKIRQTTFFKLGSTAARVKLDNTVATLRNALLMLAKCQYMLDDGQTKCVWDFMFPESMFFQWYMQRRADKND